MASRSQWPGRFPSGFRKSSICYTTGNGCCVSILIPRCNSKFHVKSTFSRKPGCVKCNKGHPGSFVIQPTHVVWDRFLASCSLEIMGWTWERKIFRCMEEEKKPTFSWLLIVISVFLLFWKPVGNRVDLFLVFLLDNIIFGVSSWFPITLDKNKH